MIKIDQAFTSALLAAEIGLDIVWENGIYSVWDGSTYTTTNGVYVPTNGRAWTEAFVLPNDTTGLSLSTSNQTDGLFRVILRYPRDIGSITAKTKADQIFDAFKIASIVEYGGQGAVITNYQRQEGTPEDGWYKLVLSIFYRAKLMR